MLIISSLFAIIAASVLIGTPILLSLLFRKVVPTNMVHIVQSRSNTKPYGTKQEHGNVYWSWPSWIPVIGVTVIELPVCNFDLSLQNYEAYDKDRVPFMVDVTAFFRIKDTALAAQRVAGIEELDNQLRQVIQGAVRKVLASDNIDSIMLERAKFGDAFTNEVQDQLAEWGVESVKSMELMDIRDGKDSRVISNIMAKKTSLIEMQSRTEVADNTKKAQTAEIEADRAVQVAKQEAERLVGEQTALKQKLVGVANQQALQEIRVQEKITKERDMEVKQVEEVRQAEIARDKAIVKANEEKQTSILVAEGALEAKKREADGIKAEGSARAEAEKQMQLAPVQAQITLAKEIGENQGYQQYLITIEAVKSYAEIGKKQAEALREADIKVIANSGTATSGLNSVTDIFSTKGGTSIGGMVEAIAQTPMGKSLLKSVGVEDPDSSANGASKH